MANPPIHIIVEHGRVTLTGVVNSNVERGAWRARWPPDCGELSVVNELRTDSVNTEQLARDASAPRCSRIPCVRALSVSLPLPHRPPDQRAERQHCRGERAGEQPERSIENRLALHPHFDRALHGRRGDRRDAVPRRGCCRDGCRSARSSRDRARCGRRSGWAGAARNATISLPSQPTFFSVPGLQRRGADGLAEQMLAVSWRELVARPRERRRLLQAADVVELEIDLDELTAAAAPRPRHARDPRDTGDSYSARIAIAIDDGSLRIEIETAQRDERGDRRVDRQRRGAVERDRSGPLRTGTACRRRRARAGAKPEMPTATMSP